MCDRYLNRLRIDFLCEIDRPLDRVPCLARKSNNEVAVDPNTHFLTILREGSSLLDRCALFYVLEDLRITRLEPYNEEPRSSVSHCLECFIIAIHTRSTGPPRTERLQLCANIEYTIFADVERIIVEEKFFGLRKQSKRLPDLPRHILAGASAPGMS